MCLCFYNFCCHNILLTAQAFAALKCSSGCSLCPSYSLLVFPVLGAPEIPYIGLLQYQGHSSSAQVWPFLTSHMVSQSDLLKLSAHSLSSLISSPPKKRAALVCRLITTVSEGMKKLPWKTWPLGQSRLSVGNTTCRALNGIFFCEKSYKLLLGLFAPSSTYSELFRSSTDYI